ncbi:hypothetical protein IW262DRAFT_1070666 [Armillaria fumosa]|nr:hypothetical protein IW262DRAFT_1070666 [Armillaria fumosa]
MRRKTSRWSQSPLGKPPFTNRCKSGATGASRASLASFLSQLLSPLDPLLCLCFSVFDTFTHTLCDENASVEKPRSTHCSSMISRSPTGICWTEIFKIFIASAIRGSLLSWYLHPSFFAIAVVKYFLYHAGRGTITFHTIRRGRIKQTDWPFAISFVTIRQP